MGEAQKLIILGTRAFAEEVADLVRDCREFELFAFGENWEKERCSLTLLGHRIIWIDDLPPFAETHLAISGIGIGERIRFIKPVEAMGFSFATLRHPTAHLAQSSRVGAGTILSAGTVVAAQTTLGQHVIVNRGSLIGHHTTIADYVTIAPGANIAGRVVIGEGSFIGIGATIINDIKIGCHAVIGAGALVTKDLPDNVQAMGVPAHITKQNIDGR